MPGTSNGVLGGLQIGYNFQAGAWVYGLEADIGLSNAKKTLSGGNYGYTINTGDSRALQAHIDKEYAMWADVIKTANIQAN